MSTEPSGHKFVPPKEADDPAGEPSRPVEGAPFPIVGIGASAGGLESFTELLKHLPLDTGMGFVLVQHLDPQHESALTQLLARATKLPVREVTNHLRVEADHVYVIPPNTDLAIAQGVLNLRPRRQARTPHRSIDFFLESLAEDQRERAIGVILSGTATDGTLGLTAIKAEGGITFAQDDSARYDSMPLSAVAAGCVDFVLSPEDIAKELARIARHPYVAGQPTGPSTPAEDERASATAHEDDETAPPSGGRGSPRTGAEQAHAEGEAAHGTAGDHGFKKVLLLLRNHSGVDFSLYKSTTIQRRITRRLVLNKLDTPEHYADFLRGNAKELDALYSDALISVTSFFRNPETFDVLKRKVFPRLLQQRGDEPVRVWVLGCSTGQEAYSIAMAFVESTEKASRMRKLQVFATDLNDALLDKARHGLYAKGLAEEVTPERLRRFFVEEEGGYRVVKSLREMVVFARQNLISDPPFSRMDLISCRNLLIYLEPGLQKKALPTFHYALKREGFLLLGASESIGGFTDLFEPADKKHRIYSRKAAPTRAFQLPVKNARGEGPSPGRSRKAGTPPGMAAGQGEAMEGFRVELDAQREADRVTVNQFAPPGVLIDAELQILQFRGPTGAYLEPPTGKASFEVLKMAREGLMLPLRAAIGEAKKENKTARREDVRLQENGKTRSVNLEVIPLKNLKERCFLIVFEDAEKVGRAPGAPSPTPAAPRRGRKTAMEGSRRVADLESELFETRDYLQAIQEQHEAANEELQASNEEVQSANEELQSLNEELETSKEELESTNEELTTVNEEMVNRNTELNRLNGDLVNIQASAHLAIVLLGRDLCIRRFSAQAEKQFDLLATDIGRPFGHVRHNLVFEAGPAGSGDFPVARAGAGRDGPDRRTRRSAPRGSSPDLEGLIAEVIATVREGQREVRDREGRWYSLRVRPYLTLDNKVDGAVLVLVDIDDLKRGEQAVAAARDYAEAIIQTARDPLVILDADLRIHTANEAFYGTFKVSPTESEGRLIYELGNHQWRIPKLRHLLEDVLPHNSSFDDFEVTHDFDGIGRRTMLLNARRLDDAGGRPARILLGIQDVSEVLQFQAAARESQTRYEALIDASAQIVWTTAPGGAVVEDSPSWRAFTGRTYEQWKGSGWLDALHPDDRERVSELWQRAVAERTAVETEYRLRHVSGDWRWTAVRTLPVWNPNGSVREWVGMNIDITERKRAEQAQNELAEQLATELAATQQLQQTSTQLIHEGNPDVLYQQILNAAVTIMHSDMASIQMVDDGQDALRFLAWRGFDPAFAQTFGSVRLDMRTSCSIARREGRRVVVPDVETCEFIVGTTALEDHRKMGIRAVQSTPLVSRDGRILGMVSTHWRNPHRPAERDLRRLDILARQAADLIERGRAEGSLREADRRKNEFLAVLAHELRNPLAPICNALEILRLTQGNGDAVRSALAMMERQIGQMVRLVDDLLDVSRISRGKIELRAGRVELASVVEHAVEAARPLLESRDHELSVTLPPLPIYLNGDPTRLAQVVGNLLNNACKFTERGGRNWLSVEREGGQAVIRVRDTGIGIAADQLPRIFEMFTQVDSSVERTQGGLGIGLTLVRELVEMHGGTVEAHSAGIGQGSEFVVRLPILAEQLDPSPEPAISEPTPTTPRRILVVDDNLDSAASLAMLLTLTGNETRTAYDGLEAVEAAATFRPDVILLDIGLPELSGYDVARRIRGQPWGKKMVLVALTGWGQEEDRRRSEEAGFDHHLTKPIDPVVLTTLLARLSAGERRPTK